ncbi:hypothetical protein [Desulfobacterium sp. N47]|uniref:Uncharacterized protein n=1 Tax=uncultured Desulfobacterium sp. TaxID=201089 RepID=E1YLK7_9BACT|nr:unknown protein [uncultured Desulfobacterium sp.]
MSPKATIKGTDDQSELNYKNPSVLFGGDLTIFKTPVSGVYYHENNDDILLIYQATDAKPVGVKVSDINVQMQSMFDLIGVKAPEAIDVLSAIPENIKDIIKDYTLSLHVIYLKVAKTNPEASVEYALWISIDLDDEKKTELKGKLPVVLDSLFLKIWSTKDDEVLKNMNISQIEQLINSEKKQKSLTS